jgi:hypothetical protein
MSSLPESKERISRQARRLMVEGYDFDVSALDKCIERSQRFCVALSASKDDSGLKNAYGGHAPGLGTSNRLNESKCVRLKSQDRDYC